MTLKLKALGLSLFALLALGGFAAASAHAVTGKLTNVTAGYPDIITGDQDGGVTKFVIGKAVRTITCGIVQYESTIAAATESVVFTPKYENCAAAPGNLPTVFEPKACKWTATVPNVAENKLTTTFGGCAVGAPMVIKIESGGKLLCEYHVGNGAGLAGSTWQNKVAEDVTFTINVQPVTEVTFGTAINCGAAAGGLVANKVEGASTITGWENNGGAEGAAVGIMIG